MIFLTLFQIALKYVNENIMSRHRNILYLIDMWSKQNVAGSVLYMSIDEYW